MPGLVFCDIARLPPVPLPVGLSFRTAPQESSRLRCSHYRFVFLPSSFVSFATLFNSHPV
jgi:hypothetical protein